MTKDKMTATPWRIVETTNDPDFVGDLLGKNLTGIAGIYAGNEYSASDAAHIVSAINNTYGQEINPEAVPDMLKALQRFTLWAEKEAMWDKTGTAYYMAKWALNKAKL